MQHGVWKGLTRLGIALGSLVFVSALNAQGTWTWLQQCSSNGWFATCGGTDVCATNPTRYWYYNNWGQSSCGSTAGLSFPGVGSDVIFPANANASLSGNVDVRTISVSSGATFSFVSGLLRLRNPADNAPGTLTNEGLLRMVSTSLNRDWAGLITNTGTLRHEAAPLDWVSATLQSSGTIELLGGSWNSESGTNLAQNSGTLTKTTTSTFTVSVPFDNRGTVSVQQGELVIRGGGVSGGGTWNVATNGVLTFINHGLVGSHTGSVQGTAWLRGTLTVGSSGATLNWSGNGLAFEYGLLNAGSAGLTNAGVLRMVSTSLNRDWAGLITNTGTLRHEAAPLDWVSATLQSSGTIELLGGSWNSESGTNLARNLAGGKLLKLSTGSFTIGIPVQNTGLIDHREGSLTLNRLTQTDGETRIRAGRTLTLSNPMQLQGGKLTGAGTLSGNVITSDDNDQNTPPATIAPGISDQNEPTANPLGILTIDSNLTLDPSAVLEVELAGTDNSDPNNPQYDQLRIAGSGRTVQLAGTLRLKGRDGYVPDVGHTFDVIVRMGSSWTRTGNFSRVEVSEVAGCPIVEVRYLADRVQVRVVSLQRSPDIDRSGCVDDSDLLAVLFAFGSQGNPAEDIDCNGVVDDSDLLSVLFAFGQGC